MVLAHGKVQARGQITIPRSIRKAAGVKPGDVAILRATSPGTIELHVLPRLTLAEILERYKIEGPTDWDADREAWEDEAVKEMLEKAGVTGV